MGQREISNPFMSKEAALSEHAPVPAVVTPCFALPQHREHICIQPKNSVAGEGAQYYECACTSRPDGDLRIKFICFTLA